MDTKERRQAAQDGDKQYYTGRPCIRRHTVPRYTSTGVCTECNKLAAAANRQEIRQAMTDAKAN